MLFSVNPMRFISVNEEMIDAGIASAAMITARKFRMNSITTIAAKRLPNTRCSSSEATDA